MLFSILKSCCLASTRLSTAWCKDSTPTLGGQEGLRVLSSAPDPRSSCATTMDDFWRAWRCCCTALCPRSDTRLLLSRGEYLARCTEYGHGELLELHKLLVIAGLLLTTSLYSLLSFSPLLSLSYPSLLPQTTSSRPAPLRRRASLRRPARPVVKRRACLAEVSRARRRLGGEVGQQAGWAAGWLAGLSLELCPPLGSPLSLPPSSPPPPTTPVCATNAIRRLLEPRATTGFCLKGRRGTRQQCAGYSLVGPVEPPSSRHDFEHWALPTVVREGDGMCCYKEEFLFLCL